MIEQTRKFRVGEKVRLVRNLGPKLGRASNEYYQGGTTSQMKLGTHGVIECIGDDLTSLSFRGSNGQSWSVHSAELEYLVNLVQPLSGIESIETHPLLEMAEQNPIFVVDGKVYAGNEEVGTVASLDELAMSRIEPQLEQVRQNYANQIWKETGIENRLGNLSSNLGLYNLIDTQIFSYLRGEAYNKKIQGLVEEVTATEKIDEKEKSNRLNILPLVKEVLNEVTTLKQEVDSAKMWDEEETTKKRTKSQLLLDHLFGYNPDEGKPYEQGIIQAAVGRENFAIINREAKYLIPPTRTADVTLADGQKFDFGITFNLPRVVENYRRVISQLARKQVLETKFSEEEIQKVIEEKTKTLGKFAGVNRYEEADFGFMERAGTCYVMLKIPEFVMKCPRPGITHRDRRLSEYYYSQESAIIRPIRLSEGRLVAKDSFYRYYPESDSFDQFCIGQIKLAENGKSNGEITAKNLIILRNVLFAGNSLDWYSGAPQYKAVDSSFAKSKIESGVLSLEGMKT